MDKKIPKEQLNRERRRKLIIIGAATAAVVAAIALATNTMRKTVDRSELEFATVGQGDIEISISCTGRVAPSREEIVTSPIASRIVEIYHYPGDSVTAGTPIMKLDLNDTQAEVEKMADNRSMAALAIEQQHLTDRNQIDDILMRIKVKEMEVDKLKVEVENERYLDSLGSGTGDRVRQSLLSYKTAMLEVEQLRRQLVNIESSADMRKRTGTFELGIAQRSLDAQSRLLNNARILSPLDGVITIVNGSVGQSVTRGDAIATIADLTHFKVDSETSDNYAELIQPGAKAIVSIGKKRGLGRIISVKPQSSNGLVQFSVALVEGDSLKLRPGLRVDVHVVSELIDSAVIIPNIQSYSGPGQYNIYVLSGDDELELRTITLGGGNYDNIEVISGLTPGETIVTSNMKKYQSHNNLKIK